jgi:hypothetical protein
VRSRPRASRLLLTLALALCAGLPAGAHVVVSRGSLRQYLQHSALALRVEFLAGPEVWEAPRGGDRQEYFRVRILERLAGEGPARGELEFFPHAEGFPGFGAGEQALLFLERTAERPEFAAHAARFPWFSVQGAGEEWRISGAGDPTLGLARAWLAWLAAGGQDAMGLAALLAQGLASDVEALQRDAFLELVRARERAGLLDRPEAVARFAPFVDDPRVPISRRAALLQLLAGRPGFEAEAAFARLSASARAPRERERLVRQLAGSQLAPVGPWLALQAASPDAGLRRAAVAAQGQRGAGADLALLERALADADPGVARAAVRALGAVDSEATRRLLSRVAAGGDAERARWAAAELRRPGQASSARPPR